MLFNSLEFVLFFPCVVLLFYGIAKKYRWILLLAASYYFYMCWKPEYVLLIMLSTLLDYYAGIQMQRCSTRKERRPFLLLSILGNLGMLLSFKYVNFFSQNANVLFEQFNLFREFPIYELVLPVGISFYTFQTLSYSIEVYKGKIKAERHLGFFALYVSYFPQLVAGPIERPHKLLPQLRQPKIFNEQRVLSGLRLMVWGFAKKLVIADRLAWVVEMYYSSPDSFEGSMLLLVTFFFAIQIYCDFSGYSDIAIGAARVMGTDLMINFRRPYFAQNLREFWHRWHISLSTWFKDYVYIPLGGNKGIKWRWQFNLLLTFVVSGFWHGAKWTFICWGLLHGLVLLFERGLSAYKVPRMLGIIKTFAIVCVAWVFFRANDMATAATIFREIADVSSWNVAKIPILSVGMELLFILMLFFIEWRSEIGKSWENQILSWRRPARWAFYYIVIFFILIFGVFEETAFIYFQF